MKRKDFILKSAASLMLLNSLPVYEIFAAPTKYISADALPSVDDAIRERFERLIGWMNDKNSGWAVFFEKTGVSLKIDDAWNTKKLENLTEVLMAKGFDDFAGNKLIEPGNPSLSLLYHALASPRVTDDNIKLYPTFKQLDDLENFIYALTLWDTIEANKNYHLAVLAYEYRPAYKTPVMDPGDKYFSKHAQLVYSRTGIGRVGEYPYNYDRKSRSFTNLPDGNIGPAKSCAVTPARFGLFLVELVNYGNTDAKGIKLMNPLKKEALKKGGERMFIRPVTKVFTEEENLKIEFSEYHLNEKFGKFAEYATRNKVFNFLPEIQHDDLKKEPFKRISCTDESQTVKPGYGSNSSLVKLERSGDSAILSSIPDALIKPVEYKGQILYFEVPKKKGGIISNQRYSSFKMLGHAGTDALDAIFESVIYRKRRRTSEFKAPRNSPLFANIKFRLDTTQHPPQPVHLGPQKQQQSAVAAPVLGALSMEDEIAAGKYFAELYQDNICDGCVAAKINLLQNPDVLNSKRLTILNNLKDTMLPALSIISAPDFFPFIDGNDIHGYYFQFSKLGGAKARLEIDENFLEGGTLNLSSVRARGNTDIMNPYGKSTTEHAFKLHLTDDPSFDTLTAVVSDIYQSNDTIKNTGYSPFKHNYQRDYNSNSFIADTGTGILYPGWDVTYSNDATEKKENTNLLIATYGLGAPFPEDMKLCAAANGMWPVESPDAGRTFHGSLDSIPFEGRPGTAIPLMDEEIGYHRNSPYGHEKKKETFGWDGEQGPFLQFYPEKSNVLVVNFTDIGRADYVYNVLHEPGFDFSQLRDKSSQEMVRRMQCITEVIRCISRGRSRAKAEHTKYWLVGAEYVKHWETGADAFCIPQNLVGSDNHWAKKGDGLKGQGYLFVFAKTKIRNIAKELDPHDGLRRNQLVTELCVCKIAKPSTHDLSSIKWCRISNKFPKNGVNWNNVYNLIDWTYDGHPK